MKTLKQIREDGAVAVAGPTNTSSGGAVAGIGQPPGSKSGEPGVSPKRKSPVMFKNIRRNPDDEGDHEYR